MVEYVTERLLVGTPVPPRIKHTQDFLRPDQILPLLVLVQRYDAPMNFRVFSCPIELGCKSDHVTSDGSALLAALDSGQLSGAVLDVRDPEPLPPDHALWSHPNIVLTPHIAAIVNAHSAAETVIANIRRHQSGSKLIGLVDRGLGY